MHHQYAVNLRSAHSLVSSFGTFGLAVVFAANPNPEMLSRPRVVVVSDGRGNLLQPPLETDLGATGADGQFVRTIIKTADPDRYGIRVSDYIV